ncbi:MAG: UDP-N-acetylglucosamine kinase [Motiliproteus sp.]
MFQGAVSILTEKIHDLALKQRQSFLLDGTLTNLDKAISNIERSLSKGRFVQILYVYQEPSLAWDFAQARERTEGRKIQAADFIHQYYSARQVVNSIKKRYGSEVHVDLLLKNTDNTPRVYKGNIDMIDYHIPEQYNRRELELLIQDY